MKKLILISVLSASFLGCRTSSSPASKELDINGKSTTVPSTKPEYAIRLSDRLIALFKTHGNFDPKKNCLVTVSREENQHYGNYGVFVKFYHAPCGSPNLESKFSFEVKLAFKYPTEFIVQDGVTRIGVGQENKISYLAGAHLEITHLCDGKLQEGLTPCNVTIPPTGPNAGLIMSISRRGQDSDHWGIPSKPNNDRILGNWPKP